MEKICDKEFIRGYESYFRLFFVPEKSLIKQVKRIEKYKKKKNGSGREDMIMQRKSVKTVKT